MPERDCNEGECSHSKKDNSCCALTANLGVNRKLEVVKERVKERKSSENSMTFIYTWESLIVSSSDKSF